MAKQTPVPAPTKKAPPGKAPPPVVAAPVKTPPAPIKAPPGKAPPATAAHAPAPVKAPPAATADPALAALVQGLRDTLAKQGEEMAKIKARDHWEPILLTSVLSPPDLTFGGTIAADDWRHEMSAYCRPDENNGPSPVYLRAMRYDEASKAYVPSGEEKAPIRCFAGFPRDSDKGVRANVKRGAKEQIVQAPPNGALQRSEGRMAFYGALSEDGLYVVDSPNVYLEQGEAAALAFYPGQDSPPAPVKAPSLRERVIAHVEAHKGDNAQIDPSDGTYWAPTDLDGKPMATWAKLPT